MHTENGEEIVRRLESVEVAPCYRTGVPISGLLLILCFLVVGCAPRSPQIKQEVFDEAGTNSLSLLVVRGVLPGHLTIEHFHSLIWKRAEGTNWVDYRAISSRDFQRGPGRRRWVSDVHSLDAGKGTAVIKVAEESPPVTTATNITVTVSYSWREWNLLTNGEVRVLRVCQDPLEKY